MGIGAFKPWSLTSSTSLATTPIQWNKYTVVENIGQYMEIAKLDVDCTRKRLADTDE